MDEEKPLVAQYRARFDYTNFKHSYEGLTGDVSALFGRIDVDNGDMLEILHETDGVAFRHSAFANDGYTWFAELRYRVDTTRVSVFFPFTKDGTLDRNVEVRSERPVKEENIAGLMLKIEQALRRCEPE